MLIGTTRTIRWKQIRLNQTNRSVFRDMMAELLTPAYKTTKRFSSNRMSMLNLFFLTECQCLQLVFSETIRKKILISSIIWQPKSVPRVIYYMTLYDIIWQFWQVGFQILCVSRTYTEHNEKSEMENQYHFLTLYFRIHVLIITHVTSTTKNNTWITRAGNCRRKFYVRRMSESFNRTKT